MDIRIFTFAIVLFFGFVFSLNKSNKNKKRYIILITILFILESSLRHLSIGPDTYRYFVSFNDIEFKTWNEIFKRFGDTYLRGEGKDPGYSLIVKLIQLVSSNFNLFLFVIACWFFIPLSIILYRHSSHILQIVFAFIIYISLFRIIALSGIRQQIAMGFSFIAFLFFQNKQYKKYFISILIGSFIHISILIFTLLYFSKYISGKKIKLIHFSVFLAIPLVIVFSNNIVLFMASFIKNDYYSVYGLKEAAGGGITYLTFVLLISLLCLFFLSKEYINKSHVNKTFYFNIPLLTFFSPLILLDGSLIRIGQYFSIYLLLIIPFLFDFALKNKNYRNAVYVLCIMILIILSLSNPQDYFFFWENAMSNYI